MTARTSSSKRSQERDYSHRSLLDKLGARPGAAVSLYGEFPGNFLGELRARAASIHCSDVSRAAVREEDLVFLAVHAISDLKALESLGRTIKPNGAVWAVYPKGRKDVREADLIAAGKLAGLVDNKVVSFSETHTALRFVIPIARRPKTSSNRLAGMRRSAN